MSLPPTTDAAPDPRGKEPASPGAPLGLGRRMVSFVLDATMAVSLLVVPVMAVEAATFEEGPGTDGASEVISSSAVSTVVATPFGEEQVFTGLGLALWILGGVLAVAFLALNTWRSAERGRTLGRWVVGGAVVDATDGSPIGLRRLGARSWWVPLTPVTCGLSALLPASALRRDDRRSRTDLASGARVVRLGRSVALAPAHVTTSEERAERLRRAVNRWSAVDWPEPVRWLLFGQLALLVPLAAYLLASDAFTYADDIPGMLAVAGWLVYLVSLLLAVVGVGTRQGWWPFPTLLAETITGGVALYVLWVDLTSARTDLQVFLPALALLLTAVAVAGPITRRLRQSYARVLGAILTVVATVGLLQYVVENEVVPNRSRPNVAMEASLTEASRSADGVTLEATVKLTNDGEVDAEALGIFITARSAHPDAQDTISPDDARPAEAIVRGVAEVISGMLGDVAPYDIDERAFEDAGAEATIDGIVMFESLASIGWSLRPGATEQFRVVFDVDAAIADEVELEVEAVFATDIDLDEPTNCAGQTLVEGDREDVVDLVAAELDEWASYLYCDTALVADRNTIRRWVDDTPVVEIGYLFEPTTERSGMWFLLGSNEVNRAIEAEESGDQGFDEITRIIQDAARATERLNPVSQLTARANWFREPAG